MELRKKLFCFLIYTSAAFISLVHGSEEWKINGKGVEKLQKGEDTKGLVYRFERGFLDGTKTDFKNGIIEFELNPTHERAFFYIYFRKQSKQESEVVYLRTHKSNAPDTIQYSPVYQGKSAWQLYHGDSGTASATLPANDWVKVKMKIVDSQFSMWIGSDPEPNIKNMPLTGNDNAGSISFRGNIPRDSFAKHTALVRNIEVQHLPNANTASASTGDSKTKQGTISTFRVSPAFEVTNKSSPNIPQDILNRAWSSLTTNPQGQIEFLRHRIIPIGARKWAAAADFILHANQASVCQINLGFSDTITLMLNGKTELVADASYRYRANRQEGLMHANQLSVFLNLKAGENTIRAIVADSFGGWGLQARMIDCHGVSTAVFTSAE